MLYPAAVAPEDDNRTFLILYKGEKLKEAIWVCDEWLDDDLILDAARLDNYDCYYQFGRFVCMVQDNEKRRKTRARARLPHAKSSKSLTKSE